MLAFIVAAAYVLPIVLEAKQAADKIFVTPPPEVEVVINDAGTPEARIVPTEQAGENLPDWDKKERVNILLLGVDDRRDGEVPRSDTMIIVTIDPAGKKVGMLSIPRDLLVTIPGYGDDKINAAYPVGSQSAVTGPGLVIATIEYNFELEIHYYAEVDFDGFTKIVDTLGGVVIDVPAPIKDDEYPGEATNYTRLRFETGLQHMDGKTALRYARTRHDDNDFARGSRQQQVLQAMRAQGISLNLISKASQLLNDLGDTVRTSLSPRQSLALAKLGTEIKQEDIVSYNLLSAVSEQWSPGQPYYLIPNWAAIQQILAEMMPSTAADSASDSAGQTVDLEAQIQILNGTFVDRFATMSAERLMAEGFTDVTPAQAPNAGSYPASQIMDYSGTRATALRIAEILGLPESAISDGDPALRNGNDIVVILGDNAPVPNR